MSWNCEDCGQKNSDWAETCGRCDDNKSASSDGLALSLKNIADSIGEQEDKYLEDTKENPYSAIAAVAINIVKNAILEEGSRLREKG